MCYDCFKRVNGDFVTEKEYDDLDYDDLQALAKARKSEKMSGVDDNPTWENAKLWMTRAEWEPLSYADTRVLIRNRAAEKAEKDKSAPKNETVSITAAEMRKVAIEAKKEYEDKCFKEIKELILREAKARKFVRDGMLPLDAQNEIVSRLIKDGFAVKVGPGSSTAATIEIKWE